MSPGCPMTQELEDLVDTFASATGSLTNASKIKATFRSALHSSISTATVRSHIDCLEDAFAVSKAKRYDTKGRKCIGAPAKYYFEVVGLRNARLNFRQVEECREHDQGRLGHRGHG